jgi:hypothetical protein
MNTSATHKASANSFIDIINSNLVVGRYNKVSIENSSTTGSVIKMSKVKPEDMPKAIRNMVRYPIKYLPYMDSNGKLVEQEPVYLNNKVGWETIGKHAYHVGVVLDGTPGLREVMEAAPKDLKQVLKGTWFAGADILITHNDGTIINMVFETAYDNYLDTILC